MRILLILMSGAVVASCQDYTEMARSVIEAIETSISDPTLLPADSNWFQLATVMRPVLVGNVDSKDKILVAISNLSTFDDGMSETRRVVLEQIASIAEKSSAVKKQAEITRKSRMLLSRAVNMFVHNSSTIDSFKTFCLNSEASPETLISELNELIHNCNSTRTSDDWLRFSTTLKNVSHIDMELRHKTSVAYYATFSSSQPIIGIVSKLEELIAKEGTVDEAVGKLLGTDYAPSCPFDEIFYLHGYDKTKLTSYLTINRNARLQIKVGATICAAALYEENDQLSDHLAKTYGQLNSMRKFEMDYYNKALATIHACAVEKSPRQNI